MANRGGLGYKKGFRREVKGKDLKELKELKKPAEAVKLTMGALCVLLGEKPEKVEVDGKKVDDYWEPATKVPVGNDISAYQEKKTQRRARKKDICQMQGNAWVVCVEEEKDGHQGGECLR